MFKIMEIVIRALLSDKSDDKNAIDYTQNLEITRVVESERTKRNRQTNDTVKFIVKVFAGLSLIYLVAVAAFNYWVG